MKFNEMDIRIPLLMVFILLMLNCNTVAQELGQSKRITILANFSKFLPKNLESQGIIIESFENRDSIMSFLLKAHDRALKEGLINDSIRDNFEQITKYDWNKRVYNNIERSRVKQLHKRLKKLSSKIVVCPKHNFNNYNKAEYPYIIRVKKLITPPTKIKSDFPGNYIVEYVYDRLNNKTYEIYVRRYYTLVDIIKLYSQQKIKITKPIFVQVPAFTVIENHFNRKFRIVLKEGGRSNISAN